MTQSRLGPDGWLSQTALTRMTAGEGWERRNVTLDDGARGDGGAAALAALLDQGPVLEPIPLLRLRLGAGSATIYP